MLFIKNVPFLADSLALWVRRALSMYFQVLEGLNAVALNRQIMGATNPKEAAIGTIRADFAESIDHNAVHGFIDSLENAKQEISFFFKPEEIVTYVQNTELA